MNTILVLFACWAVQVAVSAPPPAKNFHVSVTPPGILLARPLGSHMVLLCHLKTKEKLPHLRLYFQTFDGATVLPGSNSIVTAENEWPHVKVYMTLNKTMEGPVTCVAEDPLTGRHAMDSRQIKVYNPLTVTAFPEQRLRLGKGSLVECIVGGVEDSNTVVAWFKDGKLVDLNNPKKYKKKSDGLLVKHVEGTDAGTYTCRAENAPKGLYIQKEIRVTVK